MARLCERPGCSNPAEVSYGFDAEHLVVWLDAFGGPLGARSGVLCLRHANAMVVPLGWMLDDRREPVPRLFRSPVVDETPKRRRAGRAGRGHHDDTEQLQLDPAMVAAIPDDESDAAAPDVATADAGAAEAAAVDATVPDVVVEADPPEEVEALQPWLPQFDHQDDLHGLLKTSGTLLSRAFHGTPRNS